MRIYDIGTKNAILCGDMAAISARVINDHQGEPWPGDWPTYSILEVAQIYLQNERYPRPIEHAVAINRAVAIIAAAKMQVVAEGWGAIFPLDQAWSQSELQRLLDLTETY